MISNSFSYDYCYSTYSPANSAASPECLTNDPIPSLTALLTLLLSLNALQIIHFPLIWPLLLYLRPTNSAASPEFAWGTLSWHLRNHECEAINCTPNHTRYGVLSKRYPVRGTRYEIQNTRYEVRGARYGARGTGHVVRDTRYVVQGTCGTGHSRAQMNNKDNIFVHIAYSRLDWNPPARGVAGGGCKIFPAMIFTNNNHKKQNEDSLCTHMHAI